VAFAWITHRNRAVKGRALDTIYDEAVESIRRDQRFTRGPGDRTRPHCPMIVLPSPEGCASAVWQQDHIALTHRDPAFLDHVATWKAGAVHDRCTDPHSLDLPETLNRTWEVPR